MCNQGSKLIRGVGGFAVDLVLAIAKSNYYSSPAPQYDLPITVNPRYKDPVDKNT